MEQLMKEKNTLELKLRQEILDLKTKFGVLGDASKASINNSSVMSVSLSPEKHLSRDGLVEMLHELRENKIKQEEDIKNHAQETENMISEIKKMLDSTEFTDRRLQEMLQSQLEHLEQQRRVLVQRLWQLREKHRAVEEKLSRQLAGISPQNSSNSDSARSKCYESIIEENIRREKELLALKRQQVEDLNERITREKQALERHSKEKQILEMEMKEKEQLETELSSQRRDLERKWIGRLKEKETQLKREKEIYDENKRRDEVENILLRQPSPRTTSRTIVVDSRPSLRFPLASHVATQEESFKAQIDKTVDKKPYLVRSHGWTTNSGIKNTAPVMQKSDYSSRGEKQPSDRTATLDSRESWPQYGKSKRSSAKKKEQTGTNRMEVHIPKLELSDDSDVDLGIANDSNSWEIELDDDDSDLELYSAQSIEGLENVEEDWERRLEEELKQISASGAVLPANDSTDAHRLIFQQRQPEGGVYQEGITKSKLTALDKAPFSLYSSKVDLDTSWLRKLSYEYTHPRANHPRTSTANGTHERSADPFDLTEVSRITAEVASVPNDAASRRISQEQGFMHKKRSQGSISGGSGTSHYVADSLFPLQRKPSKESGIDSPNSARSEPMISASLVSNSRRRSLRNERASGVYLLNVDEYVDRHLVRSSEEVAKIRDLSPSEKRFDL